MATIIDPLGIKYCTILNYSAGEGDRGQHGRNFAIGHLLYMVTIKPKFGNFLMLVRPTVVKMGSKRVGDRGQVTDFGHGQWAGDRGRPNNSKWYSIWRVAPLSKRNDVGPR